MLRGTKRTNDAGHIAEKRAGKTDEYYLGANCLSVWFQRVGSLKRLNHRGGATTRKRDESGLGYVRTTLETDMMKPATFKLQQCKEEVFTKALYTRGELKAEGVLG